MEDVPFDQLSDLASAAGGGLNEGIEVEKERLQEGSSERRVADELIERGCTDLDRLRRDPRHDTEFVVDPILRLKFKLDGAARQGLDLARELSDVLADFTVERDGKADAQLGGLRGRRHCADQAQ